jgi:hypothetical protein
LSLDSATELGRILGNKIKEDNSVKENISPTEEDSLFNVWNSNSIKITGNVTISKMLYGTSSFIIDHPIYGYVDSPILSLDGGYASALVETIFTQDY